MFVTPAGCCVVLSRTGSVEAMLEMERRAEFPPGDGRLRENDNSSNQRFDELQKFQRNCRVGLVREYVPPPSVSVLL